MAVSLGGQSEIDFIPRSPRTEVAVGLSNDFVKKMGTAVVYGSVSTTLP